jgi:hypothetical protein
MSLLHHPDKRAVRPTQAIVSGNRGAAGVEMNAVDRLRLRGDERPMQFLIEGNSEYEHRRSRWDQCTGQVDAGANGAKIVPEAARILLARRSGKVGKRDFSGLPATALPAAAPTSQLLELPAKPPRWTWPKESTNWHVSANSASDATLSLCDRNHRICGHAPSKHESSTNPEPSKRASAKP